MRWHVEVPENKSSEDDDCETPVSSARECGEARVMQSNAGGLASR